LAIAFLSAAADTHVCGQVVDVGASGVTPCDEPVCAPDQELDHLVVARDRDPGRAVDRGHVVLVADLEPVQGVVGAEHVDLPLHLRHVLDRDAVAVPLVIVRLHLDDDEASVLVDCDRVRSGTVQVVVDSCPERGVRSDRRHALGGLVQQSRLAGMASARGLIAVEAGAVELRFEEAPPGLQPTAGDLPRLRRSDALAAFHHPYGAGCVLRDDDARRGDLRGHASSFSVSMTRPFSIAAYVAALSAFEVRTTCSPDADVAMYRSFTIRPPHGGR
jgi:hypothetical protein